MAPVVPEKQANPEDACRMGARRRGECVGQARPRTAEAKTGGGSLQAFEVQVQQWVAAGFKAQRFEEFEPGIGADQEIRLQQAFGVLDRKSVV